MAITNEQMNIYLGVDATIASKELEKISGELGKTNSSMKQLQGTSDSLNTNLVGLAGSQAVLSNGMFNSNQEMKSLSIAARELATAYDIAKNKSKELMETEKGRAELLQKGFDALKVAAISTGTILAGISGFSIFKTLMADGISLTNIMPNIIKTFSSLFSSVKTYVSNLSQSFNGLRISVEDVYDGLSLAGFGIGVLAEQISKSHLVSIIFAEHLGVLSGVFVALSLAMKLALSALGSFASDLGSSLISSMDMMAEKFAKAEQVASQFGFVIKNFGNSYGKEFVGSVSGWEEVISGLADTSLFSSTEIRKATKLIVAENQSLGLSFTDNTKFLNRAVEIASSSGLELIDVVQRLQSGLMGNSTAVAALGINIQSHALEHSELNKTLQKTVGTMSSMEKQQISLAEIYRQTDPLVGASIVQGQTIIGINTKIANSYLTIQSKLGSVNFLSKQLSQIYSDFLKSVSILPDTLFSVAGGFADIAGVTLKVVGTTLQYLLIIGTLRTAYTLLNVAIQTNIVLQTFLNSSLGKLGVSIGLSASKIDSMASLVRVLTSIMKGGILILLHSLGSTLLTVAKAFGAVSLAIVTSPIVLGITAITLAIVATVKAVDELNSEFKIIDFTMEDIGINFIDLKRLAEIFVKATVAVFNVLVQSIKIIILSLSELYNALKLAFLSTKRLFNPSEANILNKEIDATLETMDKLANSHTKALGTIENFFVGILGSSTAYGITLEKNTKLIEDMGLKQLQLSKAAESIDMSKIKIEVLGTEVEKLINKYKLSSIAAEKAAQEILNGSELSSQAIKDYTTALEEQATVGFQIDKAKIDSIKAITAITGEMNKSSMKNSSDESLAIIADFEEKKNKVKEFETALSALGPVAGASASTIVAAYAAIAKAKKSALAEAGQKKIKEALEEEMKQAKAQAELMDTIGKKNYELQQKALGDTLSERQKIVESLRYESEEVDRQIQQYTTLYGANSKVVQLLEKQKGLMQEAAIVQKDMADMSFSDWIDELNVALKEAFSVNTIADFVTFLQESFKEISDSPIVVRIKKVVDEAASAVSSTASSVVSDVGAMGGGAVGEVAAKAGEVIKAGADVALKAAGALVSGIAKAGGWIGQIVDIVMNADKYLKILNEMPKMLMGVLEKLPGMMLEVAKTFPQMITKIAEALPGILIQIVNAIPALIEGLLSALPVLIERLAEAFPELFIKLVSMIPKILSLLVKAYFKAIQSLYKGLIKGIGNLFSGKKIKIPDIKVDQKAFKQVARIAGDASKMFEVKDLAEQLKTPTKEMTDGVIEAFDLGTKRQLNAWQQTGAMLTHWSDEVEKIFTSIWKEILGLVMAIVGEIENLFHTIAKAILDVFTAVIKAFSDVWEFVKDMFGAIIEAFKGVWEIAKQAFASIVKAIEDVFVAVIKAFSDMWEGVKQIFAYIVQAFSELWELAKEAFASIVKAIGDVFVAAIKAIKDSFDTIVKAFSDMWEGVKQIFAYVIEAFGQIWEVAKEAFATIVESLGNVFTSVAKAIKDTMDTVIKAFADMWVGVKAIFKNIVEGFATVWSELKEGFNKLWDGFKNIISDAFKPISELFSNFKFPTFSWPEIKIPTLSWPEFKMPTFSWPEIKIPAITVPTITLPEFDFSTLNTNMTDAGKALGNAVSSAIKKPFNVFIDVLNGLKFPGLSWNISAGKLGSWSGKLWDEIDLIPGTIARLAKGGLLESFGTPVGTDTIPAMLSPGEFVVSRKGVEANGIGMLQQMNAGNRPQTSGGNTYNIEFNIQVDAKTTMDESYIKNNLIPKMRENLKRASLDGEFVINARGIRP